MVIQRLGGEEHAFLILDDQGRLIGRVRDTEYPLDREPPADTVYMKAVGRRESGVSSRNDDRGERAAVPSPD